MLAKRIITGVIGGALTIGIIYEGGWLFFFMMILLAILGWHEYCNLVRKLGANLSERLGAGWIVCFFAAYWFGSVKVMMLLAVAAMLWLLLQTVLFHGKIKPVDSAYTLYGLLYVSGGFLAMLALRNGQIASYITDAFSSVMLEPARFFMFLLIFSTWASDTFAFAVGKVKGKNKLCPSISPGKTQEGALGGFIGTVVTALVFSLIFQFSLIHALAIGIIIAVAAPLGDLVESILKRVCQVKDSGTLIPGHGGVLDRFDSLLFAAPAVYVYLTLIA